MARCPFPDCSIDASSASHLKRHLVGRPPKGHGVPEMDAEIMAAQAFAGNSRAAIDLTPKPPAQRPAHPTELLDDPYASFLIEYFQNLADFRVLPKYQLERRLDAIVALFLPEVLRQLQGWEIESVTPEFPLKKSHNNQSTNVDHLYFRHADPRPERKGPGEAWIFFELKTDAASCRDVQDQIYFSAMDRGMPSLLADLAEIWDATKAGTKYAQLRPRVGKFPADRPIELVYLAPCERRFSHTRALSLTFQQLQGLKLARHNRAWELFYSIVLANL